MLKLFFLDFRSRGDDWLVPGMMFTHCSLWCGLGLVTFCKPARSCHFIACLLHWFEVDAWALDTSNPMIFYLWQIWPNLRWLGPGLSGVGLSNKNFQEFTSLRSDPKLRPADSCRSSCSLLLCHLRALAVTSLERLEIPDTVDMPGWSFPSWTKESGDAGI